MNNVVMPSCKVVFKRGVMLIFALFFTGGRLVAATPAQIQTAIDKGKAYLYSIETNGNWEEKPAEDPTEKNPWSLKLGQYGGITAIATVALLSAGEDPQTPRLKEAIEWLKHLEMHGVYAVGMRAQVWNLIPLDDSVRDAMRKDRDLLLNATCNYGDSLGYFGYLVDPHQGKKKGDLSEQSDKSVSQYGVLGLWALNQAGVEIPGKTWKLFEDRWKAEQLAEGAWCYGTDSKPGKPGEGPYEPTMSMTAAGVATLFITQDYTNMAPRCAGNIESPSIDAGMKWLGTHMDQIKHERLYYTLFGISRVGLASGFKYIGQTDWFKWGSDQLVRIQDKRGFWSGGSDNFRNIPGTAFSLLFLSRGRAPVMINKLQYDLGGKNGAAAAWNQRPRDVANLVRMVGRQIESPQSWQIVDLHQGQKDLHDAPILYMSGSAAPTLSLEDQAHLKTFIEEGGLVLGHADCASASFSEGFKKLGQAMFPGRFFSQLPENHSIYTEQNFPRRTWSTKPTVFGLNNGDRELMLLLPSGDPAKVWQSQSFTGIKQDIFGQLMIDILLYSEDQQALREKGDTYMVARDSSVQATRTIKLARLKYAGNWNPEPGGWRRLADVMHNERKIDLDAQVVELVKQKLDDTYQAAELTVAGNIKLTDAELAEIRDYVNKGGTLVMDVAGGIGSFRSSAEAVLGKLFPETVDKELDILPESSPVYGAGHSIKGVVYRHSARLVMGNLHTPRLRGLMRDSRTAVFYSPEDLVAGLVGQPVGGVIGYAPESATNLMANILTYAAKH